MYPPPLGRRGGAHRPGARPLLLPERLPRRCTLRGTVAAVGRAVSLSASRFHPGSKCPSVHIVRRRLDHRRASCRARERRDSASEGRRMSYGPRKRTCGDGHGDARLYGGPHPTPAVASTRVIPESRLAPRAAPRMGMCCRAAVFTPHERDEPPDSNCVPITPTLPRRGIGARSPRPPSPCPAPRPTRAVSGSCVPRQRCSALAAP